MTALDPERHKLLEAKLGSLLTWKHPDVVKTVGPFDPDAFVNHDTARKAVIEACTAKLRTYTEDQIEVLVHDRDDEPDETCRDWRDFRRAEIEHLNKRTPPWFAGGFGHPDYRADFDYWAKMRSLNINELLHLSVGIEPASFSDEFISNLRQANDIERLWPPLQFLLRREEQLVRQFCTHSRRSQIPSRQFLEWAERMRFEVPPEFARLLRDYHVAQGESGSSENTSSPADKREINKIAQLFTAMAIDHLGYKPKATKSPTPKEITDLAAGMGLKVSEDTVRKYLRIGASFIPDDWEPE